MTTAIPLNMAISTIPLLGVVPTDMNDPDFCARIDAMVSSTRVGIGGSPDDFRNAVANAREKEPGSLYWREGFWGSNYPTIPTSELKKFWYELGIKHCRLTEEKPSPKACLKILESIDRCFIRYKAASRLPLVNRADIEWIRGLILSRLENRDPSEAYLASARLYAEALFPAHALSASLMTMDLKPTGDDICEEVLLATQSASRLVEEGAIPNQTFRQFLRTLIQKPFSENCPKGYLLAAMQYSLALDYTAADRFEDSALLFYNAAANFVGTYYFEDAERAARQGAINLANAQADWISTIEEARMYYEKRLRENMRL